MMRRASRNLGLAILFILLAVAVWWAAGGLLQRPPGISAAALTPAPTPADDRRVAVLTLTVTSDEAGQVVSVVMADGLIRPGYGPNVLDRPGAWTVSLRSTAEEVLRFGIPDPRLVRVEGGAGDSPHTSVFLTEAEFEVTLPLADAVGNDLSVSEVRLLDQTGNLIFVAALRGVEIVPIPSRQVPAGAAGPS
jgi:hypothetical protein